MFKDTSSTTTSTTSTTTPGPPPVSSPERCRDAPTCRRYKGPLRGGFWPPEVAAAVCAQHPELVASCPVLCDTCSTTTTTTTTTSTQTTTTSTTTPLLLNQINQSYSYCVNITDDCDNGFAGDQAERTDSTHCAWCKAGFELDPKDKLCRACPCGKYKSGGSRENPRERCVRKSKYDGTNCHHQIECAKNKNNNPCGMQPSRRVDTTISPDTTPGAPGSTATQGATMFPATTPAANGAPPYGASGERGSGLGTDDVDNGSGGSGSGSSNGGSSTAIPNAAASTAATRDTTTSPVTRSPPTATAATTCEPATSLAYTPLPGDDATKDWDDSVCQKKTKCQAGERYEQDHSVVAAAQPGQQAKGFDACVPCPRNQYQDLAGHYSPTCRRCEYGTMTTTGGAQSVDDCRPVNIRIFRSSHRIWFLFDASVGSQFAMMEMATTARDLSATESQPTTTHFVPLTAKFAGMQVLPGQQVIASIRGKPKADDGMAAADYDDSTRVESTTAAVCGCLNYRSILPGNCSQEHELMYEVPQSTPHALHDIVPGEDELATALFDAALVYVYH